MMDIEKICAKVKPEMRGEVETLARAVEAMQKKLEDQTQIYNGMPLAQMLTTTQGEKALKANPAVQEYRATVRDYAAMLGSLNDLISKYEMKDVDRRLTVVGSSKWAKTS